MSKLYLKRTLYSQKFPELARCSAQYTVVKNRCHGSEQQPAAQVNFSNFREKITRQVVYYSIYILLHRQGRKSSFHHHHHLPHFLHIHGHGSHFHTSFSPQCAAKSKKGASCSATYYQLPIDYLLPTIDYLLNTY